MKKRIAVFPGSFDPITIGHESIIRRALILFDEIVIGIGNNTTKKYYFPLEQRQQFIRDVFKGDSKITVKAYSGLTVDFCKEIGAEFILRGLRTSADYEFERAIAQMNHSMSPEIETIFLVSEPALSHISSTIVRDILLNKGDISPFVPAGVAR
jgi:pantetheine-phosphate adenylyltransferase